MWRIRLYYCLTLPFALPALTLYLAIASVFVTLSMCCCAAFCCGKLISGDGTVQPKKGVTWVVMILGLPVVLMLYDMGYHHSVLEDFVQWLTDDQRDGGSVRRELEEIPTWSLSSSSSQGTN